MKEHVYTRPHQVRRARIRPARRINRSAGGTAVILMLLGVLGLFMALPLYLTIINSFKPLNELWVFPPRFYVINPTLQNFGDLLTSISNSTVPFSRYVFNTAMITVVGTTGQILIGSLCAYAISKLQFPGHQIYFRIIVLSLMFSPVVTAIPTYMIMAKIGWIDSYLAILVPAMGGSLGLYLMKQFIDQLPDSLLEAARIDGAGEFYTHWHIVMPNVKSAWLTLIVLSVQSLWSMGASPFIYTENYKTINYALGQILASGIARAGVGAAVAVVMMALPIAVFIITQSNVIETMSNSGIKE